MPRHLGEAEQGDISDTQDEDEIGDDEVNEAGDESAFDEETADSEHAGTADSEHAAGLPSFDRQQWLDLVKWAHNTNALSHEDRIRIVKLGRLIQKGRRLTRRQEAQLAEPVALARARGYQANK